MTLPGRAADLEASAAIGAVQRHPGLDVSATTVEGRPAVVVERVDETGYTVRALVTGAPWGDLLVVTVKGEGDQLDAGGLGAVAAATREATAGEWDAAGADARGGASPSD
jgi:hypothetical protein